MRASGNLTWLLWMRAAQIRTWDATRLRDSMSCEGYALDGLDPNYALVVKFRHLRQDARLAHCKRALEMGRRLAMKGKYS